MANNSLQPGEYTIINVKTKTVLDVQDGKAVGYPYIMSPSQKWAVARAHGDFWTIQNCQSRRYLGMDSKATVWLRYHFREVDHPFLWEIEGTCSSMRIAVPYSTYVLDLDWGKANPGTAVIAFRDWKNPNQRWICTPPVTPNLEDGMLYSIVNYHNRTAITLNNKKQACSTTFKLADRTPGLSFEAIKTATGWAFKHVETGRFLGLPPDIVPIDIRTRIVGVDQEFTWLVLPADPTQSEPFKIWVPYTNSLVDLDGGGQTHGNGIYLHGDSDKPWKRWGFEPVTMPGPSGPILGERLKPSEL